MIKLPGITILTNEEYDNELGMQDVYKRLATTRGEELDALKVALEQHNEDFRIAVSDSSFYREQYARVIQVVKSLGHIADQSVIKLSDIEDEYLHG